MTRTGVALERETRGLLKRFEQNPVKTYTFKPLG